MNYLIEFVFELIFEIIGSGFESGKEKNTSLLDISYLVETTNQDSYIAGLLATVIAISYEDDHKLDQTEKKMINQLIKKDQHDYELTKKSRKNLKYIRRHKIGLDNLKIIYVKLNIDYYMMTKITNDLEYILKYSQQDTSKKVELIHKIREMCEDI